ncbi:MAG: DUF3455 domain-containing protein [Polyangiales bacterium]
MLISMPPARRNAVLVALLALAACAADVDDAHAHGQTQALGRAPRVPPVPDALAAPAGHVLAFTLGARGDQVYACGASGDGFAWTFVEPEATLFEGDGCRAGEHYAGPTWEARDGSTVVAAKAAEARVDARAIPWLLLKTTSNGGDGRMAKVTYVQRIATEGGLAPSSACDAKHVGARRGVPYRATYTFFRAER